MKKRDISISVAVIAASILLLYSHSQGTGRIEIRASGADAVLNLRSGWFGTAIIKSGAALAEVSARIHRPESLKVSMQRDGNTWQLEGNGPWGQMSTIRVKNDDTAVLEFGPPFTINPKVHGGGPQVSIDLTIVGRAGEQYHNVIIQNGKRIAAPRLEIVDENGNVLTTGRFEYG
ncbi:MAG: hypothetical protein ABIF19_10210 [Planctomycetota bacterium]